MKVAVFVGLVKVVLHFPAVAEVAGGEVVAQHVIFPPNIRICSTTVPGCFCYDALKSPVERVYLLPSCFGYG